MLTGSAPLDRGGCSDGGIRVRADTRRTEGDWISRRLSSKACCSPESNDRLRNEGESLAFYRRVRKQCRHGFDIEKPCIFEDLLRLVEGRCARVEAAGSAHEDSGAPGLRKPMNERHAEVRFQRKPEIRGLH